MKTILKIAFVLFAVTLSSCTTFQAMSVDNGKLYTLETMSFIGSQSVNVCDIGSGGALENCRVAK